MSLTCENVEEGNVCGAPATHIVFTPWSIRAVCGRCKYIFEGQGREVQPFAELEFGCDWPIGGGVACGQEATYFVGVDDFPKPYHRPLCAEHSCKTLGVRSIRDSEGVFCEYFDPRLVPHKPPTQKEKSAQPVTEVSKTEAPQARIVISPGKVEQYCWCGAPGKPRGGTHPLPLCDEHAPEAPPPAAMPTLSQPPPSTRTLRDAFLDVAQSILELGRKKLENLRR